MDHGGFLKRVYPQIIHVNKFSMINHPAIGVAPCSPHFRKPQIGGTVNGLGPRRLDDSVDEGLDPT